MQKKELMTGDIIVNKSGYLGIVLKDPDCIVYQTGGLDDLDDFSEDMRYTYNDEFFEGDIMQVFRNIVGYLSFTDIDEEFPIYQRNPKWRRPTEKEIKARERKLKRLRERQEAIQKAIEMRNAEDTIYVVAQQFYGNRTGYDIKRDEINFFLQGILEPKLFPNADKEVDRQVVKIPNTDNLVLVYDQKQEDRYVHETFPKYLKEMGEKYKKECGKDMQPIISCVIPELNLTLHTRCFVCRIDENGDFQSLEKGDGEKFIDYLPM